MDAGFDACGAGAVEDEQELGEERVALASSLLDWFGEGVLPLPDGRYGRVLVESGVTVEFGGEAFGAMVARSTSTNARSITPPPAPAAPSVPLSPSASFVRFALSAW